ncbi:MAG: class I SAM-dependent methyltransferase [Candidatus Pacebacteria bacterium]|nr:class I SAM-dependent methyltransferase [Candidatus Paceibacterota bacterium]
MDYHEHKKYFETAYKTGSDTWPRMPVEIQGVKLMEQLPKDALILDIGSGRGFFAKHMADMGYRVIGIDFEGGIVKKANEEIKSWGLEGKLKFMEANTLDIPFADASFDGACDFGLLENLYSEDWNQYANEVARILKPGGFYLNVSISRETKTFFDFSPKASPTGDVEKYGIHYHFFEPQEIQNIFTPAKLNIVSQENTPIKKPREMILLETLLKKS